MASIWEPAAAALKTGDDSGAMRILVDGFGGPGRFDGLSPEARHRDVEFQLLQGGHFIRRPFPGRV